MPRGRKPTHLNVVPISPLTPGQGRPEPPELPKEEQQIWQRITDTMPAGWFHTSFYLLRSLCCHIATLQAIAAALAKARAQRDWILVKRLLPMLERETRTVAYLSSVLSGVRP
jgi:hypothetical protein